MNDKFSSKAFSLAAAFTVAAAPCANAFVRLYGTDVLSFKSDAPRLPGDEIPFSNDSAQRGLALMAATGATGALNEVCFNTNESADHRYHDFSLDPYVRTTRTMLVG